MYRSWSSPCHGVRPELEQRYGTKDDREELQDAKDILNDPLTDAEKTAIERLRTV
jgi:hypothetical protein